MTTDNNLPALKPCPFCGGEAIYRDGDLARRVTCKKCVADIYRDEWALTYERNPSAIESWNTRAPTELEKKLVEALWQAKAQIKVMSFHSDNDATESTLALIQQALELAAKHGVE